MVLSKKIIGALFFIVMLLGGQVIASTPNVAENVWFKGSVAEAFEAARLEKKLVFLYWGASWCPPCNELKSQVFSKPGFHDLMKNYVAVYLDGDSDHAQVWGDRLKASGYPTLLILDAGQKELLRLNTAVSFEEFARAIEHINERSIDSSSLLELASKKDLSTRDYQFLSLYYWAQLPESAYPQSLVLLKQLYEQVPNGLGDEKARFAVHYLGMLLTLQGDQKQGDEKLSVAKQEFVGGLLKFLTQDAKNVELARVFWIYEATALVRLLDGQDKNAVFSAWIEYAMKAYAMLEGNKTLSLELLASMHSAKLEMVGLRDNGVVTTDIKKEMKTFVGSMSQRALNVYERHAVITELAMILAKIGEFEEARRLLQEELKQTSTPWYYYSALAGVEKLSDRADEQLKWAKLAAASAKGSAAKIQWLQSYLNLLIQKKRAYDSVLQEYYTVVFSVRDGFLGRNYVRAKSLAKNLTPGSFTKETALLLKGYQKQCESLKNSKSLPQPKDATAPGVLLEEASFRLNYERCVEHFAQTLGS